MYDDIVKALRVCTSERTLSKCSKLCPYHNKSDCRTQLMINAANAIEELSREIDIDNAAMTAMDAAMPRWITVTERLPKCDLGAEVGNIEWIICGRVHAGCFGRGGIYRDAYFRTWTDAEEGIDAKDADYWRAVTLPEPPKEET